MAGTDCSPGAGNPESTRSRSDLGSTASRSARRKRWCIRRVSVVHEPLDADGHLVVNGKLLLTRVHPVLTPAGWREIGTLAVGDKLIGADKKENAIASIDVVPDQVAVCNFATSPSATYVANGVIWPSRPAVTRGRSATALY